MKNSLYVQQAQPRDMERAIIDPGSAPAILVTVSHAPEGREEVAILVNNFEVTDAAELEASVIAAFEVFIEVLRDSATEDPSQ